MTPEGKVKEGVLAYLHQQGAYTFMPVQMGYGKKTLDIISCVPRIITPDLVGRRVGFFVAVETKAEGKLLTKYQNLVVKEMQGAGGVVCGPAYSYADVQLELIAAGLR